MSRVRRTIVAAVMAAALILPSTAASADPSAPTNGGSANGAGASGQCTGANADRPNSCHNSTGADGN
jgi:hypothetical protein